jgi:hypothetical protein
MKHLLITLICLAISIPALAKNEKDKKQKTLPPGLEKKIERGEVLDSELYDIAVRIPNKPTKNYPNTKGTELLRLEKKIIRIANDTREVLEIFGIDTDG